MQPDGPGLLQRPVWPCAAIDVVQTAITPTRPLLLRIGTSTGGRESHRRDGDETFSISKARFRRPGASDRIRCSSQAAWAPALRGSLPRRGPTNGAHPGLVAWAPAVPLPNRAARGAGRRHGTDALARAWEGSGSGCATGSHRPTGTRHPRLRCRPNSPKSGRQRSEADLILLAVGEVTASGVAGSFVPTYRARRHRARRLEPRSTSQGPR